MEIRACYISHTGKRRSNNEDSLLVNDTLVCEGLMTSPQCLNSSEDRMIFAVADGMGGHARGEIASKTALKVFMERYRDVGAGDISDLIWQSKSILDGVASTDLAYIGFGTTVAGAAVFGDRVFVFNCGDSRVYRLNGGFLERLTKDHSLVQLLLEQGEITEEDMRTHPKKNIITSAVMGDLREEAPDVFMKEVQAASGDRFLICTDGIWESMSAAALEDCCRKPELGMVVAAVYDKAMASGARDNLSAIAVEIG